MAMSIAKFLLTFYFITQDLSDGTVLTTVSSCICPGYEAVFRCTVGGGVITVWQGSALENCSDGSIILRHSQFRNGHTINETCGTSGQVIGQTISAENGSYTSQLTINITQQIVGSHVVCTTQGEHGSSSQVSASRGIPSHPTNVQVSQINRYQLAFSWNPVDHYCPALHYSVNTTNCGECPSITYSPTIACNTTSLILPQVCSIAIQAVACNDVHGPASEQLTVPLQVLDAPSFSVVPEYSGETKYLNKIEVKINYSSDPQAATAISYTVSLTDTTFGINCGSAVIPISSCREGVCISTFITTSSSECHPSTDISVTVFATNALGNGPHSDPTLINGINDFIDVDLDFSATYTAKCRFLKQKRSGRKSCTVHYGPKQLAQCSSDLPLSSNATATTSNTVLVHLQPLNNQDSVHCYHLTASDGIHTVAVVGTFTECNPDQLSNTMSIPNSNICGSFHLGLGIENGVVCYSGTKVGSTAIYYCKNCGYETLVNSAGSLIRSCEQNGQWNGTIPNCKCTSIIGSNPELLHGAGGAVAMIILVIIMCFTFAIITLIRSKAKLKGKLEQAGSCDNRIYEEIHQISSSNMDTTGNVAYATCQAFTCNNT